MKNVLFEKLNSDSTSNGIVRVFT